MENELKRLFWGMEIISSWPHEWPNGRILAEPDRHLTLLFLGDNHLSTILDQVNSFPDPGFRIGLGGVFDRPVFLPHRDPNTAGWHIRMLEQEDRVLNFRNRLMSWTKEIGISVRERSDDEFLFHATMARQPFVVDEWKKAFQKRPVFLKNIQLYESLGFSNYKVVWTHEILAPFQSKEHTADLAFTVRGESFLQLYIHAALAIAFHFSPFLDYLEEVSFQDIIDVIRQLNVMVARADAEIGCPFKAVSFHSDVVEKDQILEWEMIVDV